MYEPTAQEKTVLCVGGGDICATIKSTLETDGYSTLIVSGGGEARRLAARGGVCAVILADGRSDVNLTEVAAELRNVRPFTPIIVVSETAEIGIPARALLLIDEVVRETDGSGVLAAVRNVLQCERKEPPLVRRVPRYRVQIPFTLTRERSRGLEMLRAVSEDLGEGGMCGRFSEDLLPAEVVLVQIRDSQRDAPFEPRARVCYRAGERYGFQFLDFASTERADFRWFCQRLVPRA